MNKIYNLYSLSALLMLCTPVLAQTSLDINTAQEMMRVKNCFSCHAIDKKLVGPSFKQVGEHYAANSNDKSLVAKLENKVLKGGAGVWGPVPMPANTQLSASEASLLVKYILTLK